MGHFLGEIVYALEFTSDACKKLKSSWVISIEIIAKKWPLRKYANLKTPYARILCKASRAQMRSICLRLAKCRHDTLIQSKRKQQLAIFLLKLCDCLKILVFLKLAHLSYRKVQGKRWCYSPYWCTHLANLKQTLRVCALSALTLCICIPCKHAREGRHNFMLPLQGLASLNVWTLASCREPQIKKNSVKFFLSMTLSFKKTWSESLRKKFW